MSTDDRAFTHRDPFQDSGSESNPCPVADEDRLNRDAAPTLLAPPPVFYVTTTCFPNQGVGVVVDDSDAPGNNRIVADCNPGVTHQFASSNERPVTYSNDAVWIIEVYPTIDDGISTNGGPATALQPDPPPTHTRPVSDGNASVPPDNYTGY